MQKIFVKNVDDTILSIQKAFQDGKLSQEDYTKQLASIDEWLPGDLLVQTDLANTLKRIAKYGNAGFYDGKTAELIINEMDLNDGQRSYSRNI